MRLYHLSEDKNLTELTPRVPRFAVEGHEDVSTPRVCFAKTISGCLSALQDSPRRYYVYVPEGDVDFLVPTTKQVRDSIATGEVWVLRPVKVNCIGIIQSSEYERTEYYSIGDDGDYVTRFCYPWRWVES